LRLLLLLLASLAILTAVPPARAAQADIAQRLQAISGVVRDEIQAGHIPGAVVVVGIGGRIVYRQAFGLRSIMPRQVPMTVDTIFDLASLTKVIATTTAIMQLAERGLIDLDKPVVTTCGGGVTAAVLLFALHLLGKDDVALYDGSWSEWGADPATPKELGTAA